MGVDASALERQVRDRAVVWCDRLAAGFVRSAQGRASRRTGEMANSIEASSAVASGSVVSATVKVGAEYGRFQDEGTGIYGPSGSRIEGNPLLAFDWAAAGGLVIVHSVAGSPATHFWRDTVADWSSIVRSS